MCSISNILNPREFIVNSTYLFIYYLMTGDVRPSNQTNIFIYRLSVENITVEYANFHMNTLQALKPKKIQQKQQQQQKQG